MVEWIGHWIRIYGVQSGNKDNPNPINSMEYLEKHFPIFYHCN